MDNLSGMPPALLIPLGIVVLGVGIDIALEGIHKAQRFGQKLRSLIFGICAALGGVLMIWRGVTLIGS